MEETLFRAFFVLFCVFLTWSVVCEHRARMIRTEQREEGAVRYEEEEIDQGGPTENDSDGEKKNPPPTTQDDDPPSYVEC